MHLASDFCSYLLKTKNVNLNLPVTIKMVLAKFTTQYNLVQQQHTDRLVDKLIVIKIL